MFHFLNAVAKRSSRSFDTANTETLLPFSILIPAFFVTPTSLSMKSSKLFIEDPALEGKRPWIRLTSTSPGQGDRRYHSIPSVSYVRCRRSSMLWKRGAAVILMSHLGCPDGKVMPQYISPVATAPARALGQPVKFLADCVVGRKSKLACAQTGPGEVILLEKLRFHIEEEGEPASSMPTVAGHLALRPTPDDGKAFRRLADQACR
ncbi:MAG: phosphoglycerate kinase [Candidatus Accumulibacter sp.]|uniref:phosphoglycerate kinase n=1 Tax=Candidatus Accumulibacter proximus TaxID=2954385 RepID=A0A935UIK9_9PROT|nr:phosphoglycerate kinase [Candidatus Accumulibacter proximus]